MNDGKKRIIKKVLKISAWTVGVFALLLSVVLTALVWCLTPDRLTPIVEDAANGYLKAQVKIGRVELTAWKTFPDLTVDIENLSVVSPAFGRLSASQRATLPADADSLAEFKSFHIGVNVLKLLYGTVSLKDIVLDGLKLNMVAYSPQLTNYDVMPPSDDSPLTLPTLYWDSLKISNCKGISYYSALDQTDVRVVMPNTSLCNEAGDKYRLKTAGSVNYAVAAAPLVRNLPFDINGIFDWNSDHVLTMGLDDFKVKVLDVPLSMSTHLSMDDVSVIDRFSMELGPVKFASVVPQLPQEYQDLFANVQSNINVSIKARLNEPYDLASTVMPSLSASLIVPDSYIKRLNYRLDNIAMNAKFVLDGKKPAASNVNLERFILKGGGIDLMLKATADNLFADPHVKADVKGNANLGLLAQVFNLPVNFTVRGDVKTAATAEFKSSDLTQNTFQRIKIDGDATLNNFVFSNPVDSLNVELPRGVFAFGSNQTLKTGGNTVEELLHFSADLRNLKSNVAGTEIALTNGVLKAGCVGDPMAIMDTTKITPFGGSLAADLINVQQPDGSSIKIKGLNTVAHLTRYNHQERVPQIGFDMKLVKISYKDKLNKMNLHDGQFNFSANIRGKGKAHSSREERMKELRKRYPRMSNDSILHLVGQKETSIKGDVIDMSVDNSFKELIRRWQIKAELKAQRGRIFTPYFPLKNRLQNVNMRFSMDSIVVKNLDYKVGHSTFNVSGRVTNIRTNLLGRNRRPLDIKMIIRADTIDFNQIMKAAAAGANYAANPVDAAAFAKMGESDASLDRMSEQLTNSSDTTMAAVLIPGNIDATIALRSRNILYGDLFMNQFNGDLLIHDRAVNLHELNAKTDIGSARFNALYAAPDLKNIKFSFDLGMQDVQVAKFLSLIPQIDTIMPLLKSVDGVINADLAATTRLDSVMNVEMPTLKAAVKLEGSDLVFMDAQTFKKVAKMLLFKNKNRNVIDKMSVEMLIENSQLELFPFMFDVDRYRLGVLGYTNMDLESRYHISVLKSPIPFKFGINIYGKPDKMHFRFGGAKYKDRLAMERTKIVDTTRINLRKQISSAFRRGANAALRSDLKFGSRMNYSKDLSLSDSISHEDSLQMIKAGIIEAPAPVVAPVVPAVSEKTADKKNKKKKKNKATASKDAKKEETAWLSPCREGWLPRFVI